jgi:transcription factor 1
MNGFSWDTYHQLEVEGFLDDVENVPWNKPNPYLHFISHLPMDVLGEQLLAQLLRFAPEQSWLFKHGRIEMSYLMHDWLWDVGGFIIQISYPYLTQVIAYLCLY